MIQNAVKEIVNDEKKAELIIQKFFIASSKKEKGFYEREEGYESVKQNVKFRLSQLATFSFDVSWADEDMLRVMQRHDSLLLKYGHLFLDAEIKVLFEDEHFVGVDKPWAFRLDALSSDNENQLCIENWWKKREASSPLRLCNQLDYATSGVLLIAKSKKAAGEMTRLFSKRLVKKEYHALLYGHLFPQVKISKPFVKVEYIKEEEEVKIEIPLSQQEDNFTMSIDPRGRDTISYLKVIERTFLEGSRIPITKVVLTPFTGRRHQLRAACTAIGHTILGDVQYAVQGLNLNSSEICISKKFILPKERAPMTLREEISKEEILAHLSIYRMCLSSYSMEFELKQQVYEIKQKSSIFDEITC